MSLFASCWSWSSRIFLSARGLVLVGFGLRIAFLRGGESWRLTTLFVAVPLAFDLDVFPLLVAVIGVVLDLALPPAFPFALLVGFLAARVRLPLTLGAVDLDAVDLDAVDLDAVDFREAGLAETVLRVFADGFDPETLDLRRPLVTVDLAEAAREETVLGFAELCFFPFRPARLIFFFTSALGSSLFADRPLRGDAGESPPWGGVFLVVGRQKATIPKLM